LPKFKVVEVMLQHTASTKTLELFFDGVSQGSGNYTGTSTPANRSTIEIGRENSVRPFNGIISDFNYNNETIQLGYGNTSADWTDQIGSNNGTVEGSPALFTGQGFDGFVKTWYDQSVTNEAGDTATGNHATQATAASQPKIVDGGSLVTDSSGNPALVGDGTDDTLFNSTLTTELDNSDLLVTAAYKDDLDMGIDGGVPRFYLRSANFSYNANNIINYTPQTGRNILSFQVVGDTQEVFGNGTSLGTASEPQSNIDGNMFNVMRAGGAFSSGPLMEVIVYNTNQSANRTAIEANIGEAYSITGIPAYDDEVDGFVETWYDQSGNSKDATQATASLQPKIVNAGSLLTDGIDFDGTSQAGLITGNFSLSQAFTTFSVSHTDDASTSQGIWSTAASATDNLNSISFFRNDDGFAVNAGSTLTTAGTIDYVADRTYLQTNVINGGSSSIFVDGATGATGNAGSTNPSGVLIIGYFKSSGYFNLDGAIKELIIYDSDQTSNRAALETNIAAATE